MALFHIEAEWNIAGVGVGRQYVTDLAVLRLVYYVVNWDIPAKVQLSQDSVHDVYFKPVVRLSVIVHLSVITGAEQSCCGRYRTGPISQPLMQDSFNCRGNEGRLSECPRSVGSQCSHGQDITVMCSKKRVDH